MSFNRVSVLVVGFLSLGSVACSGPDKPGGSDSSALAASKIPASQPAAVNTGWDDASAGPVMLLAANNDGGSTARLVLPRQTDSTLAAASTFQLDSLSMLPVDLFGPAGSAGQSTIVVSSQKSSGQACLAWPVARLTPHPNASWRVGFLEGKAAAIKLDSISGMTSADSLMTTTELARVASAANANGDPAFQGLPFIVQKGYRFSSGELSVLVGDIVRKINQEANPREEHLLLIAERSSPGGHYVVAYQSRSAGSEDAVRTAAVLAAVRFVQPAKPALVVSFQYDDGGQVGLIERTGDHQWRITWRSAYTGC